MDVIRGRRMTATDTATDLLSNYRDLVGRVDELCRRIETEFRGHIACGRGCDGCCRHISLFPVEAVSLNAALPRLSPSCIELMRERARTADPAGPCPLLADGLCLLYDARPLICRTHGMPLLIRKGAERAVDFCPLNFKGIETLQGAAVIDLDRINEALVAINALFLRSMKSHLVWPARLTVAEALLLDVDPDIFRSEELDSPGRVRL
jgi:Fe-S-cluster containining protein